jgi:hypothetical protein
MYIRVLAGALLSVFLLGSRAEAQFRLPNPASGENFNVELGLMFWSPTPEILIQTGALAALGQPEVDFVQEFGIENERFNEFRGVIRAGRKHKVRVSHVLMEYNQSTTLQRTIVFGGQTFPVSVPATADLSWRLWRFGYEWDFVARDRGLLGFIAELKYNDVHASLEASGFGTEITEVTAPIPTIGIIARVYPHQDVSITTEFTGFKMPGFIGNKISDSFSGDDFEAKMYDFDIYGTINFGRHAAVQGGYRSVTADYLVEDDAGDLKMKGLYFGGLVRF